MGVLLQVCRVRVPSSVRVELTHEQVLQGQLRLRRLHLPARLRKGARQVPEVHEGVRSERMPTRFVHKHGKKCQKCAKYECPAGYKWDGHKCALKVTKFVEKVCKGGKPKCYDKYKVCPHGFKSSGYKCVTEKVMYAAKKCPHGFFASYGKCVQERAKVCPYGYKY